MIRKAFNRFKLLPVHNPVATALLLACLALTGPIIALMNKNAATQISRGDSAFIVCQTQNDQNAVIRGIIILSLANAAKIKEPLIPYAVSYDTAGKIVKKVPSYDCPAFAQAVKDNKSLRLSSVGTLPPHPLDPAPRPADVK